MKILILLLLMEQTAAQQRGLFPAILNLASNAEISSNATCGDPEPELYCKLVEHVHGRIIKNSHCPRCDANSVLSKERHPITNAIDGTNQWWQSPSIKNGQQFHWTTITLDLKQIFQVAYIIIKAANSPRPGNWILERSLDGVTFDPWQYYAISDTECLTRYNITPRRGPPTYKSDTEVICTSYYSRLNPLEHGEIHTSLINGRPSADDLTSVLLNFTSARYIRLRLQRIRTLNADLMTLSDRDPREIDPIVTRRYYYSIKDVSVGGMCICYGHAKSCPLDPDTKRLKCVCEHNTCGESCNQCCPGYHQEPWQPGTVSEGNNCERCNCHNKAVDCLFNQTVSDLLLSLNTRGVRHGGGVCSNCQQNTAGINCEMCRDEYYRPAEVSPYSDFPCLQCNCDLRGSKSSVCSRDDSQSGVSAGQCVCHEGFAGRQCDRCAFGYRDFPRCVRCECDLSGSTNSDPCSPCICKMNVMGAHCDLCKPGFYNLNHHNPLGCTDCFCFGVSDVCESATWSTAQVFHTEAWLRPSQSPYTPPSLNGNELFLPGNTSSGHAHQEVLTWAAPAGFLGNKLLSYGGYLNYSVAYDVTLDNEDHSIPAHCDIIIEGRGQTLRLSPPLVLVLSPLAEHSVSVAMLPQKFVDGQTGVPVPRDDLLSVLYHVTSLTVRVHLNNSANWPIRLRSVSLDVADSESVSGVQAVAVETCECPWGYSGTSCETCLPGYYRVGGVLFGGNCMQCECNDHATECDFNGVCLGCTHNTTGPHCDQCLPGFYGDPAEGTDSDCRLCPCPLTEPSNSFSPTCMLESSGQVSCDQCQDGYTGSNCERCASGHYGNPQTVGGACVRCDCNGNEDVTETGRCDIITGECLRCLGNTTGRHCEVCQPGYYGDAVHAKDCRECGCVSGALSGVCDVTTGQCTCREKVTGQTCDRCQSGFFGLQSGRGCRACNCSQSGSLSESCDEAGRCRCVVGVAGDTCDRCHRGYYGFHGHGCTACTCDHTGGNCNPDNGECICPIHTEGDTCDRCETGHWGHDLTTGCKPCSCSTAGSSAPQCDVMSGQCPCRGGFSGRSCEQCAPGHHGYPVCAACGCDLSGTEETLCNTTLGVCDCRQTGECLCKVGVSGRRCEECVSGWFGLSTLNPDGCSKCFCSGLSRVCEEKGGLSRTPITLDHSPALLSLVSQSNLQGVVSGVYQQGGGDMLLDTRHLNISRLTGPLYWRLPAQFEGTKLMSYGGLLSYIITFYAEDGMGLSNQEPQVLMRGGTLRKLVIYTDMVAPSNGITTQHDIRMTEHKWKYFNSVSEKAVSHSDFMSVLSSVQYVLIKASYGTRLQQSRISNISMETAKEVESEEGSEVTGGVARLIESCICPPGYMGLSCQECAAGYFRQPQSELSRQSQKLMFVRPCVRCRCNNHSERCDTETGECQDCKLHTSGRSCERCAPGYYGNVSGSISDCSLCACPLRDNSFSPTCESHGAVGDFRCSACQTGYEGRYCERCSVGYYGSPSSQGGRCSQCTCSRWGSAHSLCGAQTGQCECNPGVKGQSCDQCDERHILQGGECVSCDDECTGVLLTDLDQLHVHFLSVNVSGVTFAPYRQLVVLENQTRDMQVISSEKSSVGVHVSRVKDELSHVTSDLRALLPQVTRLSHHMKEVDLSINNSLSQGALLLQRISSLQDSIQVLLKEAEHLNQTTEEEPGSANQTQHLEELEFMLESMRAVDLQAANATAHQELSLSESLADSLQVDFLSSRGQMDNRLRLLSNSLTNATETLQNAHMHLNSATQRNTDTHNLLNNTHTLLPQYQSVHQHLTDECLSVEGVMEENQLMLDDSISLINDLTNTTTQVEVLAGQLDQWRPLLREQVDSLVVGLKMTDALENVYRAENHAHQLQSHAHSLHSSLLSVCNMSLNGTQLAQMDSDITERVESAQQVASVAYVSASHALNMTAQSEPPLSQDVRANQNISSAVLQESRRTNETVEDLQLKVSLVTSRLGLIRDSVRNSSLLLRQPIRELQSLSNGSSVSLQQAQLRTAAVHSGLQVALQQLERLKDQLQDSSSVVENTVKAVTETNQLVAHTDTAANDAQRKLEEAEHRTEHLMERIKPLSILGETLSRNLSDIRELIDQARRQAASIKVAVQADRDCVRSYKPQIDSSNFNTLSLILKTTSKDNLLFYLGGITTVDYLAVEMHAGKVSLLWDLGSGTNKLELPGLDITNNRWTRINATRFGAQVSLSVHQLDSEVSLMPTVTGRSVGPSRVLNIDRNTVIHIGGLGAHSQSPAALRSSTFQGCFGEALLNERNIGLWNYDSREGTCGGCFSSPQTEETSFHFDGSGFSLVQKSLRSTSTSIVFQFKTLSPGGLLLYLASNNTRDFLSIELVEGRVCLTFDLGSGVLILTSNRKYNTGVWYKITLQRNKRKGYLSIMAADQSSEKEVLEAESPGFASDLNRSDLDPIYIGGLPASRPIRRQVVSRSYVGCIKNVEIARSNFDLLRDAYGVRKGCVLEAVRSVSILSGGFVQISPPSFSQEAELLFSFSSNNQSGVLLAALSDERLQRQYFLCAHLVLGALEAELGEVGGATRKVKVMKPNGSFGDGEKHSVIITINRKSLSVQVDEDHLKSVPLLPGGFPRLAPASFFIGGLPSEEESHLPIRLQDLSRTFRGCIQDLVVGGALVDLSGAVRYEGVELDSCLLQKRVGAVLPDDQDVEPTPDPTHVYVATPTYLNALTPGALTCVSEAEPSFLSSAAQFGSSRHSHMTFVINPNSVRKSVSVRLSVRSRAADGLIVLLSDSKHTDFIVVRLMGGRLMMSADLGKGPASVTSSLAINDGDWHTVSAEVSRRSVSLSVDGSSPKSVTVKGNQLDVDNTLYLGGLPHAYTSRRINVSSSLQGCIHSVSLNGAMLDLTKPASQDNVTSCFTKDQTGSYLNGSGYAILMHDGYKVGSDVSVSLEFRTSQSEGVFLGISSAKVDAIGLEMVNGQVVFNVNNGAGRVSVRSIGHGLCDGQWHRLLARKTKHSLSLNVDGRSYTTPNPYPQSTSAETNNPVYVGGYPVGVRQNCLSSSSRFRGCLRNLQLIKSHVSNSLDLSSAHFLLGVTPNSCPVV
ncbi:laminin subunit alpha-1 [Pleuronectes platessa]|uniref:laminin subunit alpha-1 n=1 Tax=Pleuronectes platessa TaxID=8262 RepID=UPI00232A3975|nr:laminin subunit alpha-1 [Pleuronectes platessa]